jgi:hypothetical protein
MATNRGASMQNHYITWLSSADNLVLASNAPISAITVVM